jgi:outer membrane lipoprotein-sorting protein
MRKLLVGLFLLACALLARAEDVPMILARMNAAAPTLHTMSANIEMVTLTAVIDDKITDVGTLRMKKGKNDSIRAVIDFSGQKDQSQSREIGFYGKTVRIYFPVAKYFQDYDLGKNSDVLNQFLLLGFGTSGDELAKSYTISAEGSEKVAGMDTTKLLLIPKDPKVKEHLSKVEIWIPVGGSNPVQQQFYEGASGNYRKVTYTDIVLNPSIKGDLEIQMPSNTKKHTS